MRYDKTFYTLTGSSRGSFFLLIMHGPGTSSNLVRPVESQANRKMTSVARMKPLHLESIFESVVMLRMHFGITFHRKDNFKIDFFLVTAPGKLIQRSTPHVFVHNG